MWLTMFMTKTTNLLTFSQNNQFQKQLEQPINWQNLELLFAATVGELLLGVGILVFIGRERIYYSMTQFIHPKRTQ